MKRVKYPPTEPDGERFFSGKPYVIIPKGYEAFIAPKGEYFLCKRSLKPRKKNEDQNP